MSPETRESILWEWLHEKFARQKRRKKIRGQKEEPLSRPKEETKKVLEPSNSII